MVEVLVSLAAIDNQGTQLKSRRRSCIVCFSQPLLHRIEGIRRSAGVDGDAGSAPRALIYLARVSPSKGVAKEADATQFWSLTPETVKSEVVKFPGKAAA
jgi:hypothetical protein